MPADQWANRIATIKSQLIERFTKAPTVTIHGAIANVWGEYEFLRDGKFGHCGVDSFNLLKTAEGWKVATILDTEETTGCPTAVSSFSVLSRHLRELRFAFAFFSVSPCLCGGNFCCML